MAERRNVTRRRRRREYAEERQKVMSDRAYVNCGAPIVPNSDTKRYCSVRCRVAAYRAGRAEASMSGTMPSADMPARRTEIAE